MSLRNTCLVQLRTGRKCQTCRTRRLSRAYGALRARGICARCTSVPSTRGVFCDACHAYEAARNDKRRASPPRFRIRCGVCLEHGHMGKTCSQREVRA